MDFERLDRTRNDDFPPLRVVSSLKFCDGFGRGHPPMGSVVMTDQYPFGVENSKVHTEDRTPFATFQFPKPLV
jgi:hypothetical protein